MFASIVKFFINLCNNNQDMPAFAFLGRYFIWHYTAGLMGCLRLLANFLWFIYHFFSISIVTRTLFSPWRRLGESYRRGFDPGRALETFIVNALMRFFGFVVRIIFLAGGLATIAAAFFFGVFIMAVFFLAPLIILGSFTVGFYLLFLT